MAAKLTCARRKFVKENDAQTLLCKNKKELKENSIGKYNELEPKCCKMALFALQFSKFYWGDMP